MAGSGGKSRSRETRRKRLVGSTEARYGSPNEFTIVSGIAKKKPASAGAAASVFGSTAVNNMRLLRNSSKTKKSYVYSGR